MAYLAVNLNLKAPYNSAVKYIYQSLPFFSLAAGSLVYTSISLFKSTNQLAKAKRVLLLLIGIVGLFLIASSLLANMATAQKLATASYLIFRVQPNIDFGYAFHVDSPINQNNILFTIQFRVFLVLLSGLLWAGRKYVAIFFEHLLRPIRRRLLTSP